jgi:hypothetical protein
MSAYDDMIEVGAFEAKNRLSELLRAAEAGRSIVITRHGRARGTVEGMVDVLDLVQEGRRQ